MLTLALLWACSTPPESAPKPAAKPGAGQPRPGQPGQGGPGMPPGPGGKHPPGPMPMGAALQDPTGFPNFHDMPAPQGGTPAAAGAFTGVLQVSTGAAGGFRPQLAVSPTGTLNLVYYERRGEDFVVLLRTSTDGATWSAPVDVSQSTGRNWGPDIAVRADGSMLFAWDHLENDLTSGWMRSRDAAGTFSAPIELVPPSDKELSSVHIAPLNATDAVGVWITRPADGSTAFQAWSRRVVNGVPEAPVALSSGEKDAWHSNTHATGSGRVLAGWDIGQGQSPTLLHVAEWLDGKFQLAWAPEVDRLTGERPNFAEGSDGRQLVTWFEKRGGQPITVHGRIRQSGAWAAAEVLSQGLGGFVFDPDATFTAASNPVVVYGWDSGRDADLVWTERTATGWSPPARVAALNQNKPGLPAIATGPDGTVHVAWVQWKRGESQVWYARRAP